MGSTNPGRRFRPTLAISGGTLLLVVVILAGTPPSHADLTGVPATYTADAEFDQGTLLNVVHDPSDQLQLDDTTEPFNFIWVAASGRGTIVKIDTETGTILGEYWSAPQDRSKNPSRTTVDANGNVWAGNRNESTGGKGSAVHIGLEENGQCVDRNNNGVIDTSTGLGDILDWLNPGGVDTNGGVSSAQDECIIHYLRTGGTYVRAVAVDGSNNVWIGGNSNRVHERYDSNGNYIGPTITPSCGGYGALVDGNGVLWSASLSFQLLRFDPATSSETCINLGASSYGLGIDTNGNIWNSNWTFNTIKEISPAGVILNTFTTFGASNDRGVVITPADNNVWIANSGGSDVSRLTNAGSLVATIGVGITPTGLAVDAAGKVWVTNLNSDSVMRIDPGTNMVDLTVGLGSGASPYNYSDMTGSTLTAPPTAGTWSVIHDSECAGTEWGILNWNANTPGDSSIIVMASSSPDGLTFGPEETVTDGVDLTVADGRYLKLNVSFNRATTGETPILFDLTIDGDLQDADDDGICDDVDEIYFSPSSVQFIIYGGAIQLYPQNVYNVPPLGASITQFGPTFLPSLLNLDALDVVSLTKLLFSVKGSGVVVHAGGVIFLQQDEVYELDLLTGVITAEPSWAGLGINLNTLDAIDKLAEGAYAFSPGGITFVPGVGLVRPQNVYQITSVGAISVVLDGVGLGLPNVDCVDVLPDGRIAFSTSADGFIFTTSGVIHLRDENVYIFDPSDGSIIESFDGVGIGLDNLDGCALIIPEA